MFSWLYQPCWVQFGLSGPKRPPYNEIINQCNVLYQRACLCPLYQPVLRSIILFINLRIHESLYVCIHLSMHQCIPPVLLSLMRDEKMHSSHVVSLASYILLLIQCHQWNVASDDTSTHSLTTPWGCGSDVSAGIVANARDWAGLLQERQLIRLGSQPSGVWQISIYHRRTGARVKLETPPLLTPRC